MECYKYKSEKTILSAGLYKGTATIHIKYNLLVSPSAKTINVKRAKAEIINKRYFTVNAKSTQESCHRNKISVSGI